MKTVCCVMLANGREAMVRRAVASFKAQTYPYKSLLIYDNAAEYGASSQGLDNGANIHVIANPTQGRTIGALRNAANELAARSVCDIIAHFDSDDWSHPNRIAEQVALLEASGKEAVGYRDMLFWKVGQITPIDEKTVNVTPGEAWLYTNRVPSYCLGTSLCYWREVWQRNPFADTSAGEDTLWLHNVQSFGAWSIASKAAERAMGRELGNEQTKEPRMIASIHGANTYAKIEPRAEEWKRVPEWDEHCRGVMAL